MHQPVIDHVLADQAVAQWGSLSSEQVVRVYKTAAQTKAKEIVAYYLETNHIPEEATSNKFILEYILEEAHEMNLKTLFDHCWNVYVDVISPDNFVRVWEFASRYGQSHTVLGILAFELAEMANINQYHPDKLQYMSLKQVDHFFNVAKDSLPADVVGRMLFLWSDFDIGNRIDAVTEYAGQLSPFSKRSRRYLSVYETVKRSAFLQNMLSDN